MIKSLHKNFIGYFYFFTGLFLTISQLSCVPSRLSKRIVVASAGKITSLDPAQANTFHALQLISSLGDTLYKINSKGDLEPLLAESLPKISDKGLTITIPLKRGVIFHDGTKFDSKAMAFSLKRFMRIGTLNYVLGGRITSVETPDLWTIRLRLSRPSSSLKDLLSSVNLTPISPKAYKDHKNKFLNQKFVGTGPYKLANFNKQKQTLIPFNGYWGNPPKNAGIDFINLSNSTSLFGALRSGEIDVLLSNSIDEDQRHALHKMASQKIIREGNGSAIEIGYITFRSNAPPLNQKLLRQSLTYSIDRSLISKRVSYGLRQPLNSLVPPNLKNENHSPWPTYNPILARALLKKAGYCNSQILNLALTFRSNVPADKLLALTWKEQVKRDLQDCLQINLNAVESTTIYRQLNKGAFEAVILDWRGAYPDPEAYLSPLLSCEIIKGNICEQGEAAISGSFWTTALVNQYLKESDLTTGEERLRKLNQVENLAADGSAYLPVWIVKPRAWSQRYLTKPEFNEAGHVLMDQLMKVK